MLVGGLLSVLVAATAVVARPSSAIPGAYMFEFEDGAVCSNPTPESSLEPSLTLKINRMSRLSRRNTRTTPLPGDTLTARCSTVPLFTSTMLKRPRRRLISFVPTLV